ncbi:MAG TPA: Asp-tRNA(Asn)/Glu-tRNA(Gln) amidotransferase subunit GatC [Vicinamibacteria bacterium]|jgi:aspartyl-tRNA(Asn)/glutamyl-tRNA(Gln) amidotransferase subunit C
MPKVTKRDVEKIADLAHLELSEEEKEKFAAQLDEILAYAKRIDSLGTEGVEPTSHALLRDDAFREDEERPSLTRDEVLDLSPGKTNKGDGLIRVPKVIP